MTTLFMIPIAPLRLEETVKRSRFILSLSHTPTVQAAKAFIKSVRSDFPDAHHHCWAHVAGHPADTAVLGFSDDGEPSGTAGKPMLNVLTHSELGEVTVVVTRYFGGVKLGKGGLVRAYSGMVKQGITAAETTEKQVVVRLRVIAGYEKRRPLHRVLKSHNATVLNETFGESVAIEFSVSKESRSLLCKALLSIVKEAQITDPLGGG